MAGRRHSKAARKSEEISLCFAYICCHFDDIFVTACTESCHFDKNPDLLSENLGFNKHDRFWSNQTGP